MFRITVTLLVLLTVIWGLFGFGAIHIPAPGIAKALFACFLFLTVIEVVLGRRSV